MRRTDLTSTLKLIVLLWQHLVDTIAMNITGMQPPTENLKPSLEGQSQSFHAWEERSIGQSRYQSIRDTRAWGLNLDSRKR